MPPGVPVHVSRLAVHPPNSLRQIAVELDRDRTRLFDIARDRARLTRLAIDENVLRRVVDQMIIRR